MSPQGHPWGPLVGALGAQGSPHVFQVSQWAHPGIPMAPTMGPNRTHHGIPMAFTLGSQWDPQGPMGK